MDTANGVYAYPSTKQYAALMTGILLSCDPYDRRSIVRDALAAAGAQPRMGHSYLAMFVPESVTPKQAHAIVTGQGIELAALNRAAGSETVDQVIESAIGNATGAPMASDPSNPAASTVPLVRALAAAMQTYPEVARAVATSPELSQFISRNVGNFDCGSEMYYLGGKPLAGGRLSDWWNRVKTTFSKKASDAANADDTVAAAASQTLGSLLGTLNTGLSDEANLEIAKSILPSAAADSSSSAASSAVSTSAAEKSVSSVSEVVQSDLASAKAQLESIMSQAENSKATATQLTRQASKLNWALAALNASDDVADAFGQVTPDFETVGDTLATMTSLIPAAKSTGSISGTKALSQALGAAVSALKGSPEGDSVINLWLASPGLSGREKVLEEDCL